MRSSRRESEGEVEPSEEGGRESVSRLVYDECTRVMYESSRRILTRAA